jgi:hypothetical protein
MLDILESMFEDRFDGESTILRLATARLAATTAGQHVARESNG